VTEPPTPGLVHVGGVVVLSGEALRDALDGLLIAHRARSLSGLPTSPHLRALALALSTAVAASGQTDVRTTPVVRPSILQPMAIREAAELLGLSLRQTRRLAPKLGGDRVSGRWLLDRQAVNEHMEGREHGRTDQERGAATAVGDD
jgi:hypothetical protein